MRDGGPERSQCESRLGRPLPSGTVRAFRFVLLVSLVVLALPAHGFSDPTKPSWMCVSGVCLGNSRASVDYRFGFPDGPDIPSRDLRVRGGRLHVCFWRCRNAVTEDGFTYYGGTIRPANRVLNVSTCDRIVRLPDGVTIGTPIPFSSRWKGYRRITGEGGAFEWEKHVRFGSQTVTVSLLMNKGRVFCIGLERA